MFRFWHAVFSPELGLWGIALAIGVGVTMALAPTIRNVRLAHPFFSIAAIWSLGCTFQWLADGGETKMKYIFAFVVGGGIFTLALGAFSWVEGNHAEHLAQATSDTRQEKPTDGKAEEKKKDADKKDSSTVSTQKKD